MKRDRASGLYTGLLRESEPGGAVGHVVHDVLGLQEDIAKDVEADAGVGLQAAEAGAAAVLERCVVDVFTRNNLLNTANRDAEVRQSGAAREGVPALSAVVDRSRHLGIVRLNDGGVDVDQSRAGVEDARDLGGSSGAADRVGGCAEAPESLAGINIDVGDGACVL